jgi:hypothetical protein
MLKNYLFGGMTKEKMKQARTKYNTLVKWNPEGL